MSLMGTAVRPSLGLWYEVSFAESEVCVCCSFNPLKSDSNSPLRCCVLDLLSFVCTRGESSTNYTPIISIQPPSSVFDQPTHRDLAIHLSYPIRRSTRTPRHKGQIITILASKALNLTVGTTRLLLIACDSRQSRRLFSHYPPETSTKNLHFLRLLRHVKQPVLTLCFPAGVGLRGMIVQWAA